MVRFNIIGYGFLDVADPSGVAFKAENPFFRFAEVSLGRSTEFSVPATDHNRQMLGFGEDPAEDGEMLRRVFPCQLVYNGGAKNGTISVTGFSSDAFTCIFNIGNTERLSELQDTRLEECVVDFPGVPWGLKSTVVDADAAVYSDLAEIIRYENGYSGGGWMPVPSVNVWSYVTALLGGLRLTYTVDDVLKKYWMVAGSMKGGDTDTVTLTQTAYDNFSFTQTQDYVEVVDIDLEWASMYLFGALVGGGSVAAKAFRAKQNIKAIFPFGIPNGTVLAKWDEKLGKCANMASHPAVPDWDIQELEGATITIRKGTVFFLASKFWGDPVTYWGWKSTDIPTITVSVTMDRDGDLALEEVWHLRNNQPDMTVFEFLKSVCVATGLELVVDGNTVTIGPGSYGQSQDFTALERVVSIDSVTRRVESWGTGTRKAVTSFDSEDYVTEPLITSYLVDNDQQQENKETKAKFSEGNVGEYGVLIEDVDASGPKFKSKKWTLAIATSSSAFLQRVPLPDPVGYEDIAVNSTAVQVRLAAQLSDFFALTPSRTWLWRGSAFVWTDASWSDGILNMTLQRVSAQHVAVTPTP